MSLVLTVGARLGFSLNCDGFEWTFSGHLNDGRFHIAVASGWIWSGLQLKDARSFSVQFEK